jgi:hypothetical protein
VEKNPPQSSKGLVFNQTKTIFIASGAHMVCKEAAQQDGIGIQTDKHFSFVGNWCSKKCTVQNRY